MELVAKDCKEFIHTNSRHDGQQTSRKVDEKRLGNSFLGQRSCHQLLYFNVKELALCFW